LVAIVLGYTCVLILLGLRLSIRLLIIQNLNILIIIIIISFLALHLESSDRYALHSTVLSIVSAGNWTRCSINIVGRVLSLSSSQVASRTERGRLMMHQALLIGNIYRIHLHVWIVMHASQILHMHVISGSNEELLLLLLSTIDIGWIASTIVLLLLLQLHVTVFIFTMRKCVIQTLRVVPCLLCTLLSTGTLCTWCLWQLEVIVATLLVWICRNRLHV